jgi:putative heme-binding domain-containing protein
MNGNHTKVLAGVSPNSPHKNYQEDFLLPRLWDANGHAVGILAPGGTVTRTNRHTHSWELMLAGFRNSYDFDFNKDGEMFTFDSDMEWDWGLPWYRPIRIIHCVPGADYGWRSGAAKWPEYYPDSLPSAVNIGVGSPTGVKFGTRSNFPEKYRRALYALDWSYGRIFAVHLHPEGASYSADYEVLVKGKPLNLTDIEFGKDGAMYFITGGRGTQSGLYRVTYQGSPNNEKPSAGELAAEKAGAEARHIRHKLESYYGHADPRAISAAWPYLASNDRFLRYAARIALEWQPVPTWKDRALAETNTQAGLAALLGLARCGGKDTQRDLLMALKKFPMDSLSLTQKLEKLRIIQLSFIRQGKPDADLAKLAIEKLDRIYPSDNEYMNRELSQILIYLDAPGVLTKTLALLDQAKTQEEQAYYIYYLRNLTNQWTLDQRKHYFDWFQFARAASKDEPSVTNNAEFLAWSDGKKSNDRHPPALLQWFKDAGRDYADGVSYLKYLVNIQKDAVKTLSADDRVTLRAWIQDPSAVTSFKQTKERKYVKHWTMSALQGDLTDVAANRNFASGKAAFNDAQCILCHRLGEDGGSVGPELSAASSKYSRRDILESILEPSKVISDQYGNTTIVKKDGDTECGRIVDETEDRIVVQPGPLSPDRVEIKKSDIAERRPSTLSPMPEGLVDQFTKKEILDLLAYIESGGKETAPNFKAVQAAKK